MSINEVPFVRCYTSKTNQVVKSRPLEQKLTYHFSGKHIFSHFKQKRCDIKQIKPSVVGYFTAN